MNTANTSDMIVSGSRFNADKLSTSPSLTSSQIQIISDISHGSRTVEFSSVTCCFTDIFTTKHFSWTVRPILLF